MATIKQSPLSLWRKKMSRKFNVLYKAAKNLIGNYTPEVPISSTENGKLLLKGDALYFCTPTAQIKLTPVNDSASEILDLFDNDALENSSLYEMGIENDLLQVIFHRFSRPVQKLTDPAKGQFHFYFETGLVAAKQQEWNLDENGLIKMAEKDCIHQGSIFITFDKNTYSKLYILGDEYGYRAFEERPGLFRIEKIYPTPKRIPEDQILQVYKGFRFLTWEASLSVASVNVTQLSNAAIPDMLTAWDNYIRYLAEEAKKKQKQYGLQQFLYAETDKGYIELTFDDDVDLEALPLLHDNVELELVSPEIDTNSPDSNPAQKFYLGKPSEIKASIHKVVFVTNAMDEAIRKLGEIGSGYIRYSSWSVDNEARRRGKAYEALTDQTNLTARNVSRLMDPSIVDTAMPTGEKAVTQAVLDTMFGAHSNVTLSETYRTAMDVAINTPDIALIQGPPGTGKTTLIRGVMSRINALDPNAKILLTTEQHDALDNAVRGMKSTMPPLVASKRFDATEEETTARLEKTIEEYHQALLSECDQILRSSKEQFGHPGLEKIVVCIQRIRRSSFDKNVIREVLPALRSALVDEAIINETSADISYLESFSNEKAGVSLFQNPLLQKINSQRTSLEAWSDDGPEKLQELIEALEFEDHDDLIPEPQLLSKLNNHPSAEDFLAFKDAVNIMRQKLFPQIGENEEQRLESAKDALNRIQTSAVNASKENPVSVDSIIDEFREKATPTENILQIVKNYASIVASTCAQATKVAKYSSIANDKAKYVIVDEAARVNPLELINAILMGIKVILVGDQMQLPQYLEVQAVSRYEKEGGSIASQYSQLLTKSLFGSLYENLERAYLDKRIRARRTVRLDEQYRMNPLIGDFISNEFYDGGIKSAPGTAAKINDFGLFNGKSLAFIDIPATKGKEEGVSTSYCRSVEIEKTIKIMAKLFSKNPGSCLDIGVLSFYKTQINEIEKKARDSFSSEQLSRTEFGTVDSFQGKEFDIVIISCVRSNGSDNAKAAVGFLSNSPNRINVALSRAKKLLVLIGDSETLNKSDSLNHFVKYAKEKGYYGAE